MSYTSWRGVVGLIKPGYRPGSLEEIIRLLPEGIGVIPLYLDEGIKEGTQKELLDAMEPIKEKVAKLAALKVDLIHPMGAPPFIVRGYRGEEEIIKSLEDRHGIPVITSGMTQVEALKALGVKRMVGITYFGDETNRKSAAYFREAGFEVLGIEGIATWAGVDRLSSQEIYAFTKQLFLKNKGVQGIWIPGGGGGWGALDAAQTLEQDLQVPVITNTVAKIWAIQKRLHIRQPLQGYGRLLAEMP
ncbi:MAG: arylmalonate decarboxylase [Deltaproteobacteria bacterium]|nr:arylmalonate decarboxylase [Deltaproteobacteria bacterium]